MKVTYDPEADAVYLRLLEEQTEESDEILPNIVLDYTKDDRVRGIEILYASETLDGNPAEVNVELLSEKLGDREVA